MLHRFHERFGTAGLIVAIVALVLALAGGAFAATGGLNGKQKKQVIKIAKKYAGQDGAPGATGPQGAPGTNGTNGTNGKDGAKGDQGIQGIQGIQGVKGDTGDPWTAGGTLPSGKTETGAYRGSGTAVGATISFNIPLAAELDGAHVKVVSLAQFKEEGGEEVPPACENEEHPGAAGPENPEATLGYLCVFAATPSQPGGALKPTKDPEEVFAIGAGTTGAVLVFFSGDQAGIGTWAVTAP